MSQGLSPLSLLDLPGAEFRYRGGSFLDPCSVLCGKLQEAQRPCSLISRNDGHSDKGVAVEIEAARVADKFQKRSSLARLRRLSSQTGILVVRAHLMQSLDLSTRARELNAALDGKELSRSRRVATLSARSCRHSQGSAREQKIVRVE